MSSAWPGLPCSLTSLAVRTFCRLWTSNQRLQQTRPDTDLQQWEEAESRVCPLYPPRNLTPAPSEAAGGWGLSVSLLQQMVVPEKSQQHLASHEHQLHKRNQRIPDFLQKKLCGKTVLCVCVKLLIWGWPDVSAGKGASLTTRAHVPMGENQLLQVTLGSPHSDISPSPSSS